MVSRLLYVLVFFSCLARLSGQSQTDFFVNKYLEFTNNPDRPSFVISTNQDKYLPGDTVFLSVLGMKGLRDGIITVSLADAKGNSIESINARLEQGFLTNQVLLPNNLKPGLYQLGVGNGGKIACQNCIKTFIVTGIEGGLPVEQSKLKEDNTFCSLQLSGYNSTDSLLVSINLQEVFPKERMPLSLIISGDSRIQYAAELYFKNEMSSATNISLDELSRGRNFVSILDRRGDLLAKDVFEHKMPYLLDVSFSKDVYAPRDTVEMVLTMNDQSEIPTSGIVSVSVLNRNLFTDLDDSSSENSINYAHSWWIPQLWKLVLDKEQLWQDEVKQSLYKKGTVLDDNGRPVGAEVQVLIYLQRNQWYAQTTTNIKGEVFFQIPDFYGKDEMLVLSSLGHSAFSVEWENDRSELEFPKHQDVKYAGGIDRYVDFQKKKRLIDESYGYFSPEIDTVRSNETLGRNFRKVLSVPDDVVDLENYIQFGSMSELINEIIPSVYYRERRGQKLVRMRLDPAVPNSAPAFPMESPVFIIDGHATSDQNFFLNLKPSDLRRISVINDLGKLLLLGLLGKSGLIVVESKLGGIEVPEVCEPVMGLAPPVSFKIVSDNAVIPDFRSTVYWNPAVILNSNGSTSCKFVMSDDLGPMQIVIQGISEDEMLIRKKAEFDVRNTK